VQIGTATPVEDFQALLEQKDELTLKKGDFAQIKFTFIFIVIFQ
jgi:hypothetical protein